MKQQKKAIWGDMRAIFPNDACYDGKIACRKGQFEHLKAVQAGKCVSNISSIFSLMISNKTQSGRNLAASFCNAAVFAFLRIWRRRRKEKDGEGEENKRQIFLQKRNIKNEISAYIAFVAG